MKRVYTVVCSGIGRYDNKQRDGMRKDDPRMHPGGGWYVEAVPAKCPRCGGVAELRGSYAEFPKEEWVLT